MGLLIDSFIRIVRGVILAVLIVFTPFLSYIFLYDQYFSNEAINKKTFEIYDKVAAQTGFADKKLPLYIYEDDIENAWTDGTKIVIYKGLINSCETWDEVAMVLGHEIAHNTLEHLGRLSSENAQDISVLETNADKMGAIYMMRAGFDICKGRKLYLHWLESGDILNGDHPPYIYRYNQLNVMCGKL